VSAGRTRNVDDDSLALAAREEADAFGVLYERYVDRIYGYCFLRLRDRGAAEDATSEVFLKALAGLTRYQGGSFSAWLFRIAHNVVVNILQRDRPHLSLEADGEPMDGSPSPEDCVVKRAEREELFAGLARLGEEQRTVIELQLAGWTSAQIAEAMGKSGPAVKMLRYRAVSRLSTLLARAGGTKESNDDG
jgi:RNA polymerase sigma-70 factor (ECF subfamily)